jgi:glutamate carboxypeptidase
VQVRGTAFGKSNVIAEHAVVTGDLRALSPEQFDAARKKMSAIVAAGLPHTSSTIVFDEGYPPMAPSEGNARLLALYDRASRDLGFGAVTAVSPDRAGAADVSFVAEHVKAVIDGVGLMGHDDHTVQETADLTTLPSQTKRMAVLLHRIAKGQRPLP